MSVYTAKTGLSSILKAYTPSEREKAKNAIFNKVRFDVPKSKGLANVINEFYENNNEETLVRYGDFLMCYDLTDEEFLLIMKDAHNYVNQISRPEFGLIVENLLKLQWIKRSSECRKIFTDFCIDIMVLHSKYVHFIVPKLIQIWVPSEKDEDNWSSGKPNDSLLEELECVHKLLDRTLTTVPISCNIVLEAIEKSFPYFKRPTYILAGYVHNMLWLLDYKPMFTEYIIQLLMQHLVIMDVHAPRNQIEETEIDDDEENSDDDDELQAAHNITSIPEGGVFEMDDCNEKDDANLIMNHQVAASLDLCLEKMYNFLESRKPTASDVDELEMMRILLNCFGKEILPKHNTHHVQFIIFYYCSFKKNLSEEFLRWLWEQIINPNVSAIIRQAAVGYLASFLARAKYIPLKTLQHYLLDLCNFAHQYIMRSDQCRYSISLKANLVFYTICQAVFYVIAFRSRDLTADVKDLHFLQSLQLSGLVTSGFNPLRVCLQAVATAFAGVTRAYQLAYCHAILERNARRRLATVYNNDMETPEETLDTFFPFDPYLLKLSNRRIEPHYLQYRPSEAEEHQTQSQQDQQENFKPMSSRKRGESEMIDDGDIDDFLVADKRFRLQDSSKSYDRELQFTYGLSPGFHT